jgi:hypothetical protein
LPQTEKGKTRKKDAQSKIKSNVVSTTQVHKDTSFSRMCEHIFKKKRWHRLNIWGVHDVNMVLDLSILTFKNQSKCNIPQSDTRAREIEKKKACTV